MTGLASLTRTSDLEKVDPALVRKVDLELTCPLQGLAGIVTSCLDLIYCNNILSNSSELSGLKAISGLQILKARVTS